VLRRFPQNWSECADVTFCRGRVFHSLDSGNKLATGKAQSSIVERQALCRPTLIYCQARQKRSKCQLKWYYYMVLLHLLGNYRLWKNVKININLILPSVAIECCRMKFTLCKYFVFHLSGCSTIVITFTSTLYFVYCSIIVAIIICVVFLIGTLWRMKIFKLLITKKQYNAFKHQQNCNFWLDDVYSNIP